MPKHDGERKYYIHGALVLTQSGAASDDRFAINSGFGRASEPFFTLFADSNGNSAPIDVQQVALWNYPLPESKVIALGGPDDNLR